MAKVRPVPAAALVAVGGKRLRGRYYVPRLQYGVDVRVGHTEGAPIAECLIEVEFGDESADGPLGPSDAILRPLEYHLPAALANEFGELHESGKESQRGAAPALEFLKIA